MFKRRIKLTILQRARDFLWPKMGWVRSLKYMVKRTVRLSDSSHKIALGLAFGASISFTPLVGTHMMQAGVLAFLFRGNLLAAAVGTVVGNPWTFPFMWLAAISLGSWLFGLFGLPADIYLPKEMSLSVWWELITKEPLRIFLPWFLGGYLCALLSFPPLYFLFFYLVRGAKLARRKARQSKLYKQAKDMTGQDK